MIGWFDALPYILRFWKYCIFVNKSCFIYMKWVASWGWPCWNHMTKKITLTMCFFSVTPLLWYKTKKKKKNPQSILKPKKWLTWVNLTVVYCVVQLSPWPNVVNVCISLHFNPKYLVRFKSELFYCLPACVRKREDVCFSAYTLPVAHIHMIEKSLIFGHKTQ